MNLLRIHSISLLTLLIICVLTNGSHIRNLKDSRILRIKPLPDKMHPRLHDDLRSHDTDKIKASGKKAYIGNRQLLTKLGLSKLRIPASHSRKRLAVESRHHARPDDSHMFVIKLPPNPYYYTNPNLNPQTAHPKNSIQDNYGKKVSSFGFQSNGKPGKIYHWNLPDLEKIISGESSRNAIPIDKNFDVSDIIDIKNTPTWSKPWENETVEKSYNKIRAEETKSLKRKSPSYYAPVKAKKNSFNNFHNYFPGNGKPKGFYVIQQSKRSSHKPTYYRKLIH